MAPGSRFPTVADLDRRARRRIPRFAYDFLVGGTGEERSHARNRAALDAVELVPRYGVSVSAVDTGATLFGRRYAAPVGIAPVGFDGMMWPGATEALARAAEAAGIPYMTGTLACATVERVADLAPSSIWFQLYPLPADGHRLSFELAARAAAAGAHVLAATLDIPVRAKRVRDLRNGLAMPYRPTVRRVVEAALAPPWSLAVARRGLPRFANIERHAGTDDRATVATFVQRNVGGGFDWDTLARLRDAWPRAMMVKGVLHPADAERAVALGIDGVLVSNHGGRQFDAAPATIDVLPAIRAAVGDRATVMLDSGVQSGLDAVRAVACGADGTLSGRAFLLALAALGDVGAAHLATALGDEVRTAMAQAGATDLVAVRGLARRHPGAWAFD